MAAPPHATLDQARQALFPAGVRSAGMVRHGSMALRYEMRSGSGPQAPHGVAFEPGDALFAPAGAAHRYDTFSTDFGIWVVLRDPKGGEHG